MREQESLEHLSYEEALKQLQTIVETLEQGDQPLEEALRLFERGQALLAHCARLLNQARLKVRLLLEQEQDLPEDLQPFFGDEA